MSRAPIFLNIPLLRFEFTPSELFNLWYPDDGIPSYQERQRLFDQVAESTAGFFQQQNAVIVQEPAQLLAVLLDYMLVNGQEEDNALLFLASGLLSIVHEQAIEDQLPSA
jgi:hypothetical protein